MTFEAATICPRCGNKIPPGEECASCADSKVLRFVHREIFLLLLLVAIALAAYFGTRAFANASRKMREKAALSWYARGQSLLTAGHADQAVAAFRQAAINNHANRLFTRSLAHALEMDGRDKEALQILLQLRDAAPEDPEINVDLGRIMARQGSIQDAIRYYHNALYGIWTGDDIDTRRIQVRRELIEFLIVHHARDQALAEILALRAHLPNTPAANLELGNLFLSVDDAQRALVSFLAVLRTEPHNQPALQGAGESAFQTGDYDKARRYLGNLSAPGTEARTDLAIATLVVENDPLEPRLTEQARYHRLLADFDQASLHLQDCIAGQTASKAAALKPIQDKLASSRSSLTVAHLRSDPNLIPNTLELVYEAEDAAARFCGPPQGLNQALFLMAQKNRRTEQ